MTCQSCVTCGFASCRHDQSHIGVTSSNGRTGDTRSTSCYFGRWLEEDLVVAIAYTYKPAVYKFTTGRALAQIVRSGKPAK